MIKGEKGRKERRRGQESLNRPGAMIDSGTALLLGAWLRSNKHECTGKVTKKAGYGGVFTWTVREHSRLVQLSSTDGRAAESGGRRSRRLIADTLYRRK